MELKFNIQEHIDSLSEKILTGISERNLLIPSSTTIDVRKEDNKFYSPTDLSSVTGYSKSSIYSILRDGCPYYQIGSKKMIHIQEFKDFISQYRVEIPPKGESYEEFETRVRKGVKLGDKLWKEFQASGNKQTLSQFSLWLFENNHTQAINRSLIINLKNNNDEQKI